MTVERAALLADYLARLGIDLPEAPQDADAHHRGHVGDAHPLHLFMPTVEWPKPVGEVLRADRAHQIPPPADLGDGIKALVIAWALCGALWLILKAASLWR